MSKYVQYFTLYFLYKTILHVFYLTYTSYIKSEYVLDLELAKNVEKWNIAVSKNEFNCWAFWCFAENRDEMENWPARIIYFTETSRLWNKE